MRTSQVVCFALITAALAAAQPPAFEVASIHVTPGPPFRVLLNYSTAGTTVTLEGYTVGDLIVEAYALENHQVEISRAFMHVKDDTPTFYDIVAKAPGAVELTRAQVRQMLQSLLTERFHLQTRTETREMSVYALTASRNPKLTPANPDAPRVSNHRVRGRNQTIELTHMTMEALAREIRGYVDRPVIDKTNLPGEFNVTLEATPYFRLTNPQPGDIDMRDAIQDALGLRLDAQKLPIPITVVERADPPTEN